MTAGAGTGTTRLGDRQANEITPELARRAIGETCLYALPNGEVRPGIVVRVIDRGLADIRVFTAGPIDAQFFGGGHGTELVNRVVYGTGPNQFSFPEHSMMGLVWPNTS
jgi:hypothetical protein